MPYSPQTQYSGDRYLYQGGSQFGQRLWDFYNDRKQRKDSEAVVDGQLSAKKLDPSIMGYFGNGKAGAVADSGSKPDKSIMGYFGNGKAGAVADGLKNSGKSGGDKQGGIGGWIAGLLGGQAPEIDRTEELKATARANKGITDFMQHGMGVPKDQLSTMSYREKLSMAAQMNEEQKQQQMAAQQQVQAAELQKFQQDAGMQQETQGFISELFGGDPTIPMDERFANAAQKYGGADPKLISDFAQQFMAAPVNLGQGVDLGIPGKKGIKTGPNSMQVVDTDGDRVAESPIAKLIRERNTALNANDSNTVAIYDAAIKKAAEGDGMNLEVGPDGTIKLRTGVGAGQATVGTATTVQKRLLSLEKGMSQLAALDLVLDAGDVGISGKFGEFADEWLAQVFPGVADLDRIDSRAAIRMANEAVMRLIAPDGDSRFSDADANRIKESLPSLGAGESIATARGKLRNVYSKLGEYAEVDAAAMGQKIWFNKSPEQIKDAVVAGELSDEEAVKMIRKYHPNFSPRAK